MRRRLCRIADNIGVNDRGDSSSQNVCERLVTWKFASSPETAREILHPDESSSKRAAMASLQGIVECVAAFEDGNTAAVEGSLLHLLLSEPEHILWPSSCPEAASAGDQESIRQLQRRIAEKEEPLRSECSPADTTSRNRHRAASNSRPPGQRPEICADFCPLVHTVETSQSSLDEFRRMTTEFLAVDMDWSAPEQDQDWITDAQACLKTEELAKAILDETKCTKMCSENISQHILRITEHVQSHDGLFQSLTEKMASCNQVGLQ